MTATATAEQTLGTARASSRHAFVALLRRDLTVLGKDKWMFIGRTVMQPLLLIFVFTYVFPKIGEAIGGSRGASAFSTLLVGGTIASAMIFQGVQAVALPLVQDFGYTREIEDRVLAPLPVELVAGEKIVAGALQCMLAGILVFPIAMVVPAVTVHLHVHWLVLITLFPLACLMASALGLTFGTMFDPRTVPMLFGVIVVPITFLGCIYYPWSKLSAIPWLKVVSLANPLVYISEGFRAALTDQPHMSLFAIYPVMVGFVLFLTWRGIAGFKKRVIA